MQEDPSDAAQPSSFGTQTPVSPIDAADRARAVDGRVPLGSDQVAVDRAFDELFGADATTNSTTTVLATRREAAAAAAVQPAAPRTAPVKARRYNPYAAIPYCIGFAIFALEAFLIV
jgi:hyaluronan synthase